MATQWKAVDGSDSIAWRVSGSVVVGLLAYVFLRIGVSNELGHSAIVGISVAVAVTGYAIGPTIWNVFRIFTV